MCPVSCESVVLPSLDTFYILYVYHPAVQWRELFSHYICVATFLHGHITIMSCIKLCYKLRLCIYIFLNFQVHICILFVPFLHRDVSASLMLQLVNLNWLQLNNKRPVKWWLICVTTFLHGHITIMSCVSYVILICGLTFLGYL